jgi:hypothetical protein
MKTYTVINTRTGAIICQCSSESDAQMMVAFDPIHRTYSLRKTLLDQIVDVDSINVTKTRSILSSEPPQPLALRAQ